MIYSSLWGGDLQAFILQGAPRGLFQNSQLVLSAADHVLPPLGDKMPNGAIIGARGAYGLMSPKTPLNEWFFNGYQAQRGVWPVQARLPDDAGAARPEGQRSRRRWRRTAARSRRPKRSPRRWRTSNGIRPAAGSR